MTGNIDHWNDLSKQERQVMKNERRTCQYIRELLLVKVKEEGHEYGK